MILDRIVEVKNSEVKALKRPRNSLYNALSSSGITVITEIKKASPSKGVIAEDFNPVSQLESYVDGGAGAVSVLTDRTFFQGGLEILHDLRDRTSLPLLRKDFLIDPLQIDQSFFFGADAVLLIAAILDDSTLEIMLRRCRSLGLEALVEVHNESELERILKQNVSIIGINNRDLRDFTVDLSTSEKLLSMLDRSGLRSSYKVVAESGIASREDVLRLEEAGLDGILVGESLMRSPSPAQAIEQLRGLR